MRICSLLPGGTEIVCALGLGDRLVGVSHECDYPPAVKAKPVVVRSAVDAAKLPGPEIDRAVSEKLKRGESLYAVDEAKLRELDPDLILTQELCRVCAPSGPEARKAVAAVSEKTRVLTLTPHTLEDIFDNIRSVGEAAGVLEAAKKLIYDLRSRAVLVQCKAFAVKKKPKVFMLEWLDPPYTAGHWVPEMVEIAGGIPDMSCEGGDSVRVTWDQVAAFAPDVLICSPCGYHTERALREAAEVLKRCPARDRIPAFQTGRVYAVDADSYITRPGPRVVDGIELLAHILNPDAVGWLGPAGAFEKVEV